MKPRVTLKSCVKYSDELLKREKDPDLHDELLCVYWLLTGDDLRAFDVLQHIWAPNVKDEDLARLDDLLQDREAHVSILREQYRHLEARHNPLSDAYRDLRGRINHIVDDDGQRQNLVDRIAELEKKSEEIPGRKKMIDELNAHLKELVEEKDRLFKKAGEDAAELDAKARQEIAEISATKAEVEREKRQLEEVDARIRERYTTIVEELRRLKETQLELRRMLEDRDAEKNRKHERLQMLENAGVATAYEVAEVWKLCRETMPRRLWEDAQAKEADGRAALKKLTDVRKDVHALRQRNKWMADEIDRYHLMISNAKGRRNPIADA
jgi:chromosome segregation ATPase